MKIKSFSQLISQLNKTSEDDLGKILSLFELDADRVDIIEAGCQWSSSFYTRNLIYRNNNYELLFLCWQPGQISPIHNHNNQHCWVNVVKGNCEEITYSLGQDGNLRALEKKLFNSGDNAYMNDQIALHSLQNIGNDNMITVHLYSNPIDNCRVFDLHTKESKIVTTAYTGHFIMPNDKF